MPEPSTLLLFAAGAIVLVVIPGSAVIFIVTRSVAHGRKAGLVSVLGVHSGSIVHVGAATAGLSALLAASATDFSVVRYAGAGYLIFLGFQRLLRRHGDDKNTVAVATAAPARLYTQGIIVNVHNPKTAIFFLAFLPQFVNPARGPGAIQMAVLGGCFILLGLLSDSTYAFLSGTLSSRLRRSASVSQVPPRKAEAGEGPVMSMYTMPAFRGRGVARAILDRLIDFARSCGVGWGVAAGVSDGPPRLQAGRLPGLRPLHTAGFGRQVTASF